MKHRFGWAGAGSLIVWLACAGAPASPGAGPYSIDESGERLFSLPAPQGWSELRGNGDGEAPDLTLRRDDGSALIFVYAKGGAQVRLEDVVAARRSALLEAGLSGLRERRYFLDGEGRVPASMARYIEGSTVYIVLTALAGQRGVEAIGVCLLGGGREAELVELLNGLVLEGESS